MRTSARRVAVVVAIALYALSGCGLFTGDRPTAPITPERDTLRVGVGSPIDTAPLRMAVADGAFARAGLRVELVEQESQENGLARLAAGNLDVAFATDVALFKAAAAGTALQLQGEAYTSSGFTMALVTLPGSKYQEPGKPNGKKNPTIAVDTLNDLGTLTAKSMLGTAGVDVGKIKFIQRPFEAMPDTLRDNEADAAWMVEPFITKAAKELGARILADSARGATLDFPVSGYASSGLFAQSNPRTLALFRQVLGEAQQRADDQALVRQALPKFSGIDPTTASLVALGSYPTSLNGVRLQRVADLMHSTGLLAARLDVQSLLPQPGQP
ncbi:ABC transporter substrate-binding protein [Amycolatopsis anabasis]|uniref:ABC transporter substrate-binding protein n=1 Tax=Amycolatopsis anabasis TaxID=1840409 RepID=UPI00131CF098|nr:ABC transporter substrate-binding protein [Amycolatopsis anabasis]